MKARLGLVGPAQRIHLKSALTAVEPRAFQDAQKMLAARDHDDDLARIFEQVDALARL